MLILRERSGPRSVLHFLLSNFPCVVVFKVIWAICSCPTLDPQEEISARMRSFRLQRPIGTTYSCKSHECWMSVVIGTTSFHYIYYSCLAYRFTGTMSFHYIHYSCPVCRFIGATSFQYIYSCQTHRVIGTTSFHYNVLFTSNKLIWTTSFHYIYLCQTHRFIETTSVHDLIHVQYTVL